MQAEKQLGRYLIKDETVHHCDENRMNYNLDNLWIFKTSGDHASYHHALKDGTDFILTRENGIYSCEVTRFKNNNQRTCPICGDRKANNGKLCLSCYNKSRRIHIPNKNELIKDIQTMSFLQIGKKYNVSDSAVRKWCKTYGLPFRRKDILSFDFANA